MRHDPFDQKYPSRRLGEVAPLQTGFAFKSEWYVGDGVRLLRNANIHQGFLAWDDVVSVDPSLLNRFASFYLNKGEIVLTLDRPIVASGLKVARLSATDVPALLNQRVGRFRPDPGQLDSDYLYAFLRSPRFVQAISGHDQSLGVPHISPAQVENVEIPVPPLDRQRQIAESLAEQLAVADDAKRASEARCVAAVELHTAYVRQAYENPESREWPRLALGSLEAETRNGLYKPDEFYGEGTRILKMFNIGRFDGRWHLERVDRIRLDPDEEQQFRLVKGDILINRVNSRELVGKCAVVDDGLTGAVFESKNIRMRLSGDVEPEFVAYWLNSRGARQQIEQSMKQIVGQATINRTDLQRLEVPIPPLAKQRQLVAQLSRHLKAGEVLVKRCEEEHDAIASLPNAALASVFSGAA